jgi:hypothetical protein
LSHPTKVVQGRAPKAFIYFFRAVGTLVQGSIISIAASATMLVKTLPLAFAAVAAGQQTCATLRDTFQANS